MNESAQNAANEPGPSSGSSENDAACRRNIARKTVLWPILSDSAGQKSRPIVSARATMTMKAEARVAEAPPIEAAMALASEMMARPAETFRKKMAHRAYHCHVLTARRKPHAGAADGAVAGAAAASTPPSAGLCPSGSLGGFLRRKAAPPTRTP